MTAPRRLKTCWMLSSGRRIALATILQMPDPKVQSTRFPLLQLRIPWNRSNRQTLAKYVRRRISQRTLNRIRRKCAQCAISTGRKSVRVPIAMLCNRPLLTVTTIISSFLPLARLGALSKFASQHPWTRPRHAPSLALV
jgi:hypothetical protein